MLPPWLCCACLFVRDEPSPAVTIIGGYAVCRHHVSTAGALLGQDWAAFLVLAGMPANLAQSNPRPPHHEPPPPTRPQPRQRP